MTDTADQHIIRNGFVVPVKATEAVMRAIAQTMNIDRVRLASRSRDTHVVHARRVASYVLRHTFKQTYPAIARALRKDHSTIVHAVERATHEIGSGPLPPDFAAVTEAALNIRGGRGAP